MPEALMLLTGLAAAGMLVLPPLLGSGPATPPTGEDREAEVIRHRVSLEALRDVETDRLAGSLDDDAYAEQLAQAEARAAHTREALDRHRDTEPTTLGARGRRAAITAAALIGAALLIGSFVPPTGIANSTHINQALADAQEAESARQDRITDLLATFERQPD